MVKDELKVHYQGSGTRFWKMPKVGSIEIRKMCIAVGLLDQNSRSSELKKVEWDLQHYHYSTSIKVINFAMHFVTIRIL